MTAKLLQFLKIPRRRARDDARERLVELTFTVRRETPAPRADTRRTSDAPLDPPESADDDS